MDLTDAVLSRQTIRAYTKKEISDKDIKKIIEAGIHAPSACDMQGWRFIIIKEKRLMQKIVDLGAASFISKAPLGILVVYDNRTDNIEYKDNIQSASACIQNMLLKAWSMDIGACWVCHLPLKRQLRRLLHIPDSFDPVAYISLGYFENKPKKRPRKKSVDELMSENVFRFSIAPRPKLLVIKRILRKVYYLLPFRKHIKKKVDNRFERRFE